MNTDIDAYFKNAAQWRPALQALRTILLDCGLTEAVKWRAPCYTFEKHNVAILAGLKDRCTISFFKGALLKDPNGILAKPGENTRAARIVSFTSAEEVAELGTILRAYVREAMELEKAGARVDFKQDADLPVPDEFQQALNADAALQAAFSKLTPGRRRAYLMYFAAAKQAKTRAARVEKYTPRILDGKGLNDCTCGLSAKLHACDGSHKQLQ